MCVAGKFEVATLREPEYYVTDCPGVLQDPTFEDDPYKVTKQHFWKDPARRVLIVAFLSDLCIYSAAICQIIIE